MFAATEMADPLLEPHGFPMEHTGSARVPYLNQFDSINDLKQSSIHGYPRHLFKMKLG